MARRQQTCEEFDRANSSSQEVSRRPVVSAVREVAVSSLRLWPGNPRTIRDDRFEDLVRAIETDPEMLWARPLLHLPDGRVFSGNMRLRAVTRLGWKTVPAAEVRDLDDQTATVWAIRDNTPYGDW